MKLSEIQNQDTPRTIKLSQLSNAPSGGNLKSLPKSENILMKAMKATAEPYFNVQNSVSGSAPVMGMYGMRDTFIDDGVKNPIANFATKVVTDPMSWMGGGSVTKGIPGLMNGVKSTGKDFFKNIGRMASGKKALNFSNELEGMVEKSGSSLSRRMGAGIESVQDYRGAGERISFNDVIRKPQFNSKVSKLINRSDDLKLYDMDNLSLQESQDVINSLKSNLRQSLKTGDVVKSDEREILRFIDELREAQLARFPEHKYVLEGYGKGIDAYNDVSGNISKMIESKGMNRIEKAAKEQSLKETSPKALEMFKSYDNTKKVIKGGAKAAGVYGALKLGQEYLK